MKIETKILKDFIRKASFGDNHMSINMDFSETGVKSAVRTIDNVGLSIVELKKEAFEEYEAIGEIFIKDTRAFATYLKTFGDIIDLTFEDEYTLKLSDSQREAHVLLGDKIVCENVFRDEMPTIQAISAIHFASKEYFNIAVKDMSMLKINQVALIKKPESLWLEVGVKGESDHFISKIDTSESGEAITKVGATFVNLYTALDNEFKLHLGNNVPIMVEEDTEFIKATYLIAPIVER